ncbi:MAG: hypothetical protein KGV44_09310 [Flavobacteriaceae bacterium]|nr:hypothetical protein [Flavobacteriaceae bacterium]
MAKIVKKDTDNPKLGQKLLKNGMYSLFLEYYLGYTKEVNKDGKEIIKKHRKKETLNLYVLKNPRTPIERQTNKETIELAKKIRFEKEEQFKESKTGYRIKRVKKINLFDAMDAYYENYTKGDKRPSILDLVSSVIKSPFSSLSVGLLIKYAVCGYLLITFQMKRLH